MKYDFYFVFVEKKLDFYNLNDFNDFIHTQYLLDTISMDHTDRSAEAAVTRYILTH